MFIAAAMMAVACAEEEQDNPNAPRQPRVQSPLSKSYQSECARCHGDEGRGMDQYPMLPGNRDEASFIEFVRTGKDEMPAADASKISDADLKADFLWMTTKRQ